MKTKINELKTEINKLKTEKDELRSEKDVFQKEKDELKKLMYTFLKLSYPESDLGDINDIGQWVQDFIRNKVKIFIMTVLLCGG